MRKFYFIFSAFITLSVLSFLTVSANETEKDFTVKDYCGIISDSAKEYINSQNEILYNGTKAKILFVTTKTTDGLSAQEYCENYYKESGLNSFGRNNSILCVISPSDKDYGFVQGSNISRILTDDVIDDFIVHHFEPEFKNENYDEAVLSMYNALALWYINEYKNLNMVLDDNINSYVGGTTTADKEEKPSHLWIWLCVAGGVIIMFFVFKIKRSIDLQIRQHERRRLKKKFKIDIDKIVNS